MRSIFASLMVLLLAPALADAQTRPLQTRYSEKEIRFVADCVTETGGIQDEVCIDTDDGRIFRCDITSGSRCNTSTEWVPIGSIGLAEDEVAVANAIPMFGTSNPHDMVVSPCSVNVDGDGITCGAGIIGARQVLTADVTTSAASAYTTVPQLTFTPEASTVYTWSCTLYVQSALGTTGLQIETVGPGSPTLVGFNRLYQNNSAIAWAATTSSAFHTVDSTDDAAAGSCTTAVCGNKYEMYLSNGANSAPVYFKIQSEVEASAVTLKAGSYCDLHELE